jgi:uncharacterized protein YyaL (SSP411 family)
MPNRLASETSPYLRQHAENPVDWRPWGPEALELARREGKPILLSIGYSACHWCHVMAHESFEDRDVAAVMNRLFVNIKVDREERPDLDQIYQAAHQMLARRAGGWPLTMFLAPDGMPFFGGTYFPKTERYGLPGFAQLCERVAAAWHEQQSAIGEQNEALREAFSYMLPRAPSQPARLERAPIDGLLEGLREQFDAQHGGFGGAPKFPQATDLELCLRAYAGAGDRQALDMARVTLERMCEGGIYDQLGGGFCRYSVDERWTIPHFEKMLYDNGPLLHLLADAWSATRDERFARCADETAAWIMREMQSPEGGYYSSLDADSEGEEGKFYVWQRDEARALLTSDEWAAVAPYFGLEGAANFEAHAWHLRIALAPQDAARRAGRSSEEWRALTDSARQKLFAARATRVRPGRDDKLLVSWNALAIRGMLHAGRVLDRPDWIASARRALAFIRAEMWRDGRLLATYKDGRAHLNAYLDDYAYLLAALIEALQADFSLDDLDFARQLADALLERFEDARAGGFFFTSHDHEQLIHRAKPGHDSSMPAGNGVAASALQRLAALTGDERYARAAWRAVELFYPAMLERPAGHASLAIALEEALEPPSTLILRGDARAIADWSRALAREFLPAAVTVAIPDGLQGLPPVLDKPRRPEPVNGWLCRGVTCLEPIADLQRLKQACKEHSPR